MQVVVIQDALQGLGSGRCRRKSYIFQFEDCARTIWDSKGFSNVFAMLLWCLTDDQDIVKIYSRNATLITKDYDVYGALKSLKYAAESKSNFYRPVQFAERAKSWLVHIVSFNLDLPVVAVSV